jgi:hypothetical protein
MSTVLFPRTSVEGVSLSRMIIGTNWILGYSHTGAAADAVIHGVNCNREAVADLLGAFLRNGVDAIMGPLSTEQLLLDAMKLAEDRTGRGLVRIDTPILNVDNTAAARLEAEKTIAGSKAAGSALCLPHHSSAEQLVNKNTRTIGRLPDYLKMIRDHGMIPGLSAHMPEIVIYSDSNEYDVQSYIQIYNCLGFMMQIEVESINNIIRKARKPVMTIKPMAAGRCTPFVGLNFVWNTIRPEDMVTVGCMTPAEAQEDIEISLAAIERRAPDLEGRASPNKTEIMR